MNADKVMGYVRFAWQLRPVVTEVLRRLYEQTGGDPVKAAPVLRRIPNYGQRLDDAELAVDARIQAVKDRDKS